MSLEDISKFIYAPGTASENTCVKVITYSDNRLLWEGKAVELQTWDNINGWLIVEINKNANKEYSEFGTEIPFFNRSWIIVVI